jgi:hypothetical protein
MLMRNRDRVRMSTRQPACAKVSAAAIATRTPDETARLHLAEVLGQVEACPWLGRPDRRG